MSKTQMLNYIRDHINFLTKEQQCHIGMIISNDNAIRDNNSNKVIVDLLKISDTNLTTIYNMIKTKKIK